MRKQIFGFTLAEMLVAVMVLAIIAAVVTPIYRKYLIRTYNKEAVLNIRLIAEAEEAYYLSHYYYLVCADTADCNYQLRLDVPSVNWGYSVESVNQAATYTVRAVSVAPNNPSRECSYTFGGSPPVCPES